MVDFREGHCLKLRIVVNPVPSRISLSPWAQGEERDAEAEQQLFPFPSAVPGAASWGLSAPITLKAELWEQPCSALPVPQRAGSLWSPFFGQAVTGGGLRVPQPLLGAAAFWAKSQ